MFYSKYCHKSTEGNLVYTKSLRDEIYKEVPIYEKCPNGKTENFNRGRGTYCLLRWKNLKKDNDGNYYVVKSEDYTHFAPLYGSVYVEGYGVFYKLGSIHLLKEYDMNAFGTGPNKWNKENESWEIQYPVVQSCDF